MFVCSFAGERLVRVACFLNLDEAGTNLFTNIPGPWPQIFLLTEKHVNGACHGYKLKYIPGPWPQIFLLTEKHVNGACRGYKLKYIPGPSPQIFLLTEKHVTGACRGYKLKSRCWFEQLSALKSCLVFVLRLCHLVVYFTLIETHVAP